MLGPLLFLIYINDFIECSDTANFVLFADDSNIFVAGRTHDEAIENANKILSCVSVYTMSNKLHINLERTCYKKTLESVEALKPDHNRHPSFYYYSGGLNP